METWWRRRVGGDLLRESYNFVFLKKSLSLARMSLWDLDNKSVPVGPREETGIEYIRGATRTRAFSHTHVHQDMQQSFWFI